MENNQNNNNKNNTLASSASAAPATLSAPAASFVSSAAIPTHSLYGFLFCPDVTPDKDMPSADYLGLFIIYYNTLSFICFHFFKKIIQIITDKSYL